MDKVIFNLNAIAQIIYDKKGLNILALDVQGLSTITDFVLIGEGNVERHVMTIGRAVIDEMEEKGERLIHAEGLHTGDWIVLDYGQIMVHLFTPRFREKYSIERLWPDSKIVDLDVDFSKPATGS